MDLGQRIERCRERERGRRGGRGRGRRMEVRPVRRLTVTVRQDRDGGDL